MNDTRRPPEPTRPEGGSEPESGAVLIEDRVAVARALVRERAGVTAAEVAERLGVGVEAASRLLDELAVERFAETYAPERRGDGRHVPSPTRQSAATLYRHLRARGRSYRRATLLVCHLYSVKPATLHSWVSHLN